MKRKLTYTADRGEVIDLDALEKLVADARAIDLPSWVPVKTVHDTSLRAVASTVKQISMESR